ncbi:MAG: lysine 2,3-aminomutase [Ignavibacteria bacterium]|nr:lysine 2,3-aminomutase [Ignavibacteria bacterium]MBT8383403.1 lysine 2,3-aminomutase [Ignavibacteria bacterium]MBT8390234.1 lysine 2,3-aminomutase [Ignavibacteria bacterium]NNL20887.1 lysine 2,3-aminomutase [Ignavibacteriaceae bacterium]
MIHPKKMIFYSLKNLDKIPQVQMLSKEERFNIEVVSNVLPFRVNNYVVEELINWENIPDDPIYQLTFMQKEMLTENQFKLMADALITNGSPEKIKSVANEIRMELNPHPAGQMTLNVPKMDEEPIAGIQHKYKKTVLIFPSSGQTCHSYCTFCFRWAQFVGMTDLKFATEESGRFQDYLRDQKEVSDVLLTGGDPMVMSAAKLAAYIEPLLEPDFDHIKNIRIGTKSVAYWPYKFVTDKDADDTLRLFEKVVNSGKHLSVMGHYNHWKELQTEIAQEAVKRIRSTGAQIRTQSPLVKHVNDDPEVWSRMWRMQIKLGCIPYYFFIERNTGAEKYFSIPLNRALDIFTEAYRSVSGLSRTVRGPSMSAMPGKVAIVGIAEIMGEKVFVLTMLQARNPQWTKTPFFAKFSETATWLNELEPAFGEERFFYQNELDQLVQAKEGQMFFKSDAGTKVLEDAAINIDE